MTIQRIRDRAGVFVVATRRSSAAALELVRHRHGEAEVVEVHHQRGLNQVAVDRVARERATRFNFDSAFPVPMKAVDLVAKVGFAVLAVKSQELHRRGNCLVGLDVEADGKLA